MGVAFGSQLSGSPTRGSDLDLAIKFADGLSDRERFDRRCSLSGDPQRDDAPFVYVSNVEAQFEDEREELRRHQRAVIDRITEEELRG